MKQTPELELYEVVRPKRLHILHKREIQNNQTEKLGEEVSSVNDRGISQSSEETIKSLFTKRRDVTCHI